MKVCKMGLESIWINHANGEVRMCGWTGYNIGNLVDNTIEELWNGEKARKFRESMMDGSYRYCDEKECPYCANEEKQSIMTDYIVPEYPKYCNISYEEQCNYVCKFCRKEKYIPKTDEKAKADKINYEIGKFINQLDTIASNGVGELFCGSKTMELLSKINTDREINIELESNGSLFNEKNWDKIKNLGKYNLTLYITVHSFDEKTYQFLSGTELPISNIENNLKFICDLRKKNIINKFEIATVICERNFREMPSYVEHCLTQYGPDKIRLRFFKPYGVQDKAIEWFYDVRNPHHPYYNEFAEVMKNPILENPKVWKWQGNTLSDLKENPYEIEARKVHILSSLISNNKLQEQFQRYLHNEKISTFAIYGNTYVGRAFKTVLENSGVSCGKLFDTYAADDTNTVKPTFDNLDYDMIIVTAIEYFDKISAYLKTLNYAGKIVSIEDVINAEKCNL